MPPVKAVDFGTLRAANFVHLNNFAELCAYYDEGHVSKFRSCKSYKGRQNGLEEMGED
jgi:hypothetical protein